MRPRRPRLLDGSRLFALALCAALAAAGILALRPEREKVRRAKAAASALRAENARLAREVARMEEGLARLEAGDAALWAKVVRTELGWVAPGEVVVAPLVPTDPAAPSAMGVLAVRTEPEPAPAPAGAVVAGRPSSASRVAARPAGRPRSPRAR